MEIKVKFLSVFASKIGRTEESIESVDVINVGELINIIIQKYKTGLKDYISTSGNDHIFKQMVKIGVQRNGEGKVRIIDYLDGPKTILNHGDVVLIYYGIAGG